MHMQLKTAKQFEHIVPASFQSVSTETDIVIWVSVHKYAEIYIQPCVGQWVREPNIFYAWITFTEYMRYILGSLMMYFLGLEDWRGVFSPGRNKKKEIKCQMDSAMDGINKKRNEIRNVNKGRDSEGEGIPSFLKAREKKGKKYKDRKNQWKWKNQATRGYKL